MTGVQTAWSQDVELRWPRACLMTLHRALHSHVGMSKTTKKFLVSSRGKRKRLRGLTCNVGCMRLKHSSK